MPQKYEGHEKGRPSRPVARGGWRAVALSLLLHSAIIAAAVYGWFSWKHRPPPSETLAIEATVVDERALKGLKAPTPAPAPTPEPVPEPPAPPVEEQGPPKPDPAEAQRKQEEELRQEEERVARDKAAQEEKAQQEKLEREQSERLEAEKAAAAKLAAQKAAAEKAAADKAEADKKALEKKRADEAAARKAAEEKARQARETELRRMLEAEERGNAARNSDVAARWHASIVAKIARAWIRPPSARPGIECSVSVTQVMGGEVTAVRVNSCTGGDQALRESVEAAVYRASPLPTPPAGVPFERNLELTFAPNE